MSERKTRTKKTKTQTKNGKTEVKPITDPNGGNRKGERKQPQVVALPAPTETEKPEDPVDKFPAISRYRIRVNNDSTKDEPYLHDRVRYYLPTGLRYTQKIVDIVSKYHPCELPDLFNRKRDNGHPLCAALRAISEAFAITEVQRVLNSRGISNGWIKDWGGAVKRHYDTKRKFIHSCKPAMEDKDLLRNFSLPGHNYCNNKAQDCVLPSQISISVHSLYYIHPDDITTMLLKQTVPMHVAVLHLYNEAKGTLMEGEMSYSRYGAEVVVSVAGNLHQYTHSDMAWLNLPSFYSETNKAKLVWEIVRRYEDSIVMKFVAVRVIRQPQPSVSITVEPKVDAFEEQYNDLCKKSYRMFEARDHKAGQAFVRRVFRSAAEKGLDTYYAQKVAWKYYAQRCDDDIPEITDAWHDSAELHNLRLMFDWSLTWWSAFKKWVRQWGFLSFLMVGVLSATVVSISAAVFPAFKSYVQGMHLLSLKLYDYCCTLTQFKTLGGREKVLFYKPPKHKPCEPGLCAYPMVYHPDHVPMMPRRCSHNIEACVRERVLAKTTTQKSEWEKVKVPRFMRDAAASVKAQIEPLSFEEWVTRFPGKKRERLTLEEVQERSEHISDHEWNASKLFMKREFNKSSEKAPRPIHSSRVELNFAVGRWMIPCLELLAEAFPDSCYFPLHGDSLEIGNYIAECAVSRKMYENDFSHYDCSQGNDMLDLITGYFVSCGIPAKIARLMALDQESAFVRGPHGLAYKARGVRFSGRSETLGGNTVGNIIVTHHAFQGFIQAMVVKGDDSVVFVQPFFGPENETEALRRFKALGLTCKLFQKTLNDVEFCSSYVVPCTSGHVLVPKPGRMLAKTFWCKNTNYNLDQQKEQFAGVLNGLKHVLHNLPITRQLYRHPVYRGNVNAEDVRQAYNEYASTEIEYNADTVNWFEQQYGLSWPDVLEMEQSLEGYPVRLDHPGFSTMIRKDWGPPNYSELLVTSENGKNKVPSVFLNAAFEEILRWVHPVFGLIIGVVETCRSGSPYNLVAHLVLNVTMWYSGFWVSLFLHWAHNVLVTAGSTRTLSIMPNRKKRAKPKQARKQKSNQSLKSLVAGLKPVIAKALRAGGAGLGNYVAPGVGGVIGHSAGAGISRIMGFGDYKVSNNSLMGAPQFGKNPPTFRVRNREFIGDVKSSIAFTAKNYTINPGNRELFPWLYSIARNYQQYKVNGMVMYFNTTSATAIGSTNTALGTVMMSSCYDLAEPPYKNKQEVLASYFSNSGTPSEDMVHAIECDPSSRPIDVLYVDQAGESVTDPSLFNLANFQIATTGMQAESTIGEFWVSYDITFMKPRLSPSGALYSSLGNGTWDTDNPLGLIQLPVTGSQMPVTAAGAGFDTVDLSSFRGETIMVQVTYTGSGFTSFAITFTKGSGLEPVDWVNLDTAATTTAASTTSAHRTSVYEVSPVGTLPATLTVSWGGTASVATSVNVTVVSLGPSSSVVL